MSKSKESATMILDTGYNTAVSGITINTEFTYEIDLRKVLGDMYDKYDRFAICLNSIINYARISSYATTPPQPTNPTAGSSAVALIGMRGLQWVSNSLNSDTGEIALFPNAFVLGGGAPTGDGAWGNGEFKNPNCIMFNKPTNSNVSLVVGLYNPRGQAMYRGGNSAGEVRLQLNYNFSIFGIEV